MQSLLQQLFRYLQQEKIAIDQKEFEFQVSSHPYHSSLLAYVDALSFFKVENFPLEVTWSEIDLLPNRFMAQFKNNGVEEYHLLEKEANQYFTYYEGKKAKIEKSVLKQNWNNLVLVVQNDEVEKPISKKFNPLWLLFTTFACFLIYVVPFNWQSIFILLPITGVLLSVYALKDLFKVENKVIGKLCNLTTKTDCSTVLKSKELKILEKINLGELSLLFFSFQTILFFVIQHQDYFNIQKLILLLAIPVLCFSVIYQAFILKKWCSICLLIISVVVLEIIFVFLESMSMSLQLPWISLLLTATFLLSFWLIIKPKIKHYNEQQAKLISRNRFYKSNEIFVQQLTSGKKHELELQKIVLGNLNSQKVLTLVINPFCGHCKKVFTDFVEIYKSKKERLRIELVVSIDISDDDSKKFAETLYNIKLKSDDATFLNAIVSWYETKEVKKFNEIYQKYHDQINLDFLEVNKNQLFEKGLSFTPLILLNGYRFPETHNREDLEYFLEDFIENEY